MRINVLALFIACILVAIGAVVWIYWPLQSEPTNGISSHPESVSSFGQPDLASNTDPNQTNTNALLSSMATTGAVSASTVVDHPPSQEEIEKQKQRRLRDLYSTPINIFGKVADQNGDPVVGATVKIGIADRPFETGSTHTLTTAAGGLFSLMNVQGIAFSASASKDGYYSSEESTGHRNVIAPSSDDVQQPSAAQPMILVLRKQGSPVPLITVNTGQINISRTGQPTSIDLATGETGRGNLIVESWIGDTSQRYQLSVPNGGLIERKEQFNFEAPPDGYQSTVEVNIAAVGRNRFSGGQREYFAKIADGRYARLSIQFYPSKNRNFVVIESFINPTAGSRNLEFDPGKVVRP